MDQMEKTEYIVEYPYTKEMIENWIKHPVSSWAKVLRALRLTLGVAALVCGVSLSAYAVATAVQKNLYVNALIAAAIFILLGIFSLTAPKRSAKHTIKQQKRFQAADTVVVCRRFLKSEVVRRQNPQCGLTADNIR